MHYLSVDSSCLLFSFIMPIAKDEIKPTVVECTRCAGEPLLVSKLAELDPVTHARESRGQPLSSAKIISIQSELSKADDDVSYLLNLAEEVTTRATDLREKAKIITQERKSRSSLIAPIRRLPVFILLRIFKMICSEGSTFEGGNLHCPPAVLRQVCFSWRGLIQSTESLWSTISLTLGYWRGRAEENLRAAVTDIITQSGTKSLRIQVHGGYNSTAIVPAVLLLWDQMHRCTTAKMTNIGEDHYKKRRSIEPQKLQQLRSLTFRCSPGSIDLSEQSIPFLFFSKAPKLRSLDLSIKTIDVFQLSSWNILTYLKLSCGSVLEIIKVTQNLKLIEELYLSISDKEDTGLDDPHRTNTLRKLTKLHLICESYKPKVYRHLFKAIKLPALQDLSLSSDSDPPGATVRAFNKSSSCLFGSSYLDLLSSPPEGSSLRTLTISRVLMSEQTLISSLAVCRQIRKLSVTVGFHRYPQISSHFPAALTI